MIEAIIEEIEIEAPPESVFEAWTTPEQLTQWWGADGFCKTINWTADLRVGGKWCAEGIKADGQKFLLEGEYLKVNPPHYLSFTWSNPKWAANNPATTVELEFRKTSKGTLLKLKHDGFTDETIRNEHKNGWARVLNWSRDYLEKKTAVKQM